MPTVQQIIDFAERFYPKGELISDANKVSDLNAIQSDVFITLKKLKNDYTIHEFFTVADDPFYDLPSDARIEDIFKVEVSDDVLDLTTSEYNYAGIGDEVSIGNFYGRGTAGLMFLFNNGYPINITGLAVRLYYYARPTLLSSSILSAVPDLDVDYHDLLKFKLIQMMASQGHDPDFEVADHWQQEYDFKLGKIMQNLSERNNNAPLKRAEARERM